MAKLTISIPNRDLDEIDRHLTRVDKSRSAFFQELAEAELLGSRERRRSKVQELLANPGQHGGDSAQHLRELRDRD